MEIIKITFNQGKILEVTTVSEYPDDATDFMLPYEPNPQGKVDVYLGADGTLKHKPYPKN